MLLALAPNFTDFLLDIGQGQQLPRRTVGVGGVLPEAVREAADCKFLFRNRKRPFSEDMRINFAVSAFESIVYGLEALFELQGRGQSHPEAVQVGPGGLEHERRSVRVYGFAY